MKRVGSMEFRRRPSWRCSGWTRPVTRSRGRLSRLPVFTGRGRTHPCSWRCFAWTPALRTAGYYEGDRRDMHTCAAGTGLVRHRLRPRDRHPDDPPGATGCALPRDRRSARCGPRQPSVSGVAIAVMLARYRYHHIRLPTVFVPGCAAQLDGDRVHRRGRIPRRLLGLLMAGGVNVVAANPDRDRLHVKRRLRGPDAAATCWSDPGHGLVSVRLARAHRWDRGGVPAGRESAPAISCAAKPRRARRTNRAAARSRRSKTGGAHRMAGVDRTQNRSAREPVAGHPCAAPLAQFRSQRACSLQQPTGRPLRSHPVLRLALSVLRHVGLRRLALKPIRADRTILGARRDQFARRCPGGWFGQPARDRLPRGRHAVAAPAVAVAELLARIRARFGRAAGGWVTVEANPGPDERGDGRPSGPSA